VAGRGAGVAAAEVGVLVVAGTTTGNSREMAMKMAMPTAAMPTVTIVSPIDGK